MHASGFPPNVLKCNAEFKLSEISLLVTTAPRGNPFPIPFAKVTISGFTSWFSKPQKCSPVLPKPV